MDSWMIWGILAGALIILELFSGTFYLLMISLGFVAGAITAALSFSTPVQLIVAAIVGSVATIALHQSRYGWKANAVATRDPNVNMDIGQSIQIPEWQDAGNGKYTARAMYRGAMWDVELQYSHGIAGTYVIDEVQGSRLIVRPA